MSLSHLTKSISTATGTLSLVTISNLIFINSAHGFGVTFTNGSFESPIAGSQNGWSTTGDVTTTGTIDGISPTNLSNQAIITTGYIEGDYPDPIGNRNDDNSFTFNQSTTNPVSADTNPNADELQSHFGFGTDAFSIDRSAGVDSSFGPRTSKEGSGMYQEFDVTIGAGDDSFTISFDWAYLTNDGTDSLLGEQDFGFWSLGRVNGSYNTAFSSTGNPNDEIIVLESSSGTITSPAGNYDYVDNSLDYATNGRYSYTVSGLTAGTYTYRVGFGVVDVDGLDRTSALMIDNVEVVPFEFSPGLGLLLMTSLFGFQYFQRKHLHK